MVYCKQFGNEDLYGVCESTAVFYLPDFERVRSFVRLGAWFPRSNSTQILKDSSSLSLLDFLVLYNVSDSVYSIS